MVGTWKRKFDDTIGYLSEKVKDQPSIGIILGSGLGPLADEIICQHCISYDSIPHFPRTTVKGHQGRLIVGTLEEKLIIAMQGRFHYYEGYELDEVVYPVRVMGQLGVKSLIVTNAAGGVNLDFKPGDLMLIKDHLNLLGANPLRGGNFDFLGPRFPDMTEAYCKDYIQQASTIADGLGIKIKEGIYAAVSGPSYETPAEIRYLREIGADAVGMSTVPEVIAANHMGIKTLGVSCITNMAAGVLNARLHHQEVMDTAKKAKDSFISLIKGIIKVI